MSRAKQVLKRKRRCKIGPVLGAAGLSLSLAGGVSAATAAPVADALAQNSVVSHEITLDEEEIADVNLATFYVFDKENTGPSRHAATSQARACSRRYSSSWSARSRVCHRRAAANIRSRNSCRSIPKYPVRLWRCGNRSSPVGCAPK